jgi:hypothetical protein
MALEQGLWCSSSPPLQQCATRPCFLQVSLWHHASGASGSALLVGFFSACLIAAHTLELISK